MKVSIILDLSVASLVALASAIVAVVGVTVAQGNLNALVFGIIVALLVVGGALNVVSWVAGMIIAAGLNRWDWFVAVLLLSAPATLSLCLSQRQRAIHRPDGEIATML